MKKNKSAVKILLMVFALSNLLISAQTKNFTKAPILHKGKNCEIIIFSLDTIYKSAFKDAVKFITPQKKNIDQYEADLIKQFPVLTSKNPGNGGCPLGDQKLNNYNRQIAGYTNKANEEIIVISGAHASLAKEKIDWKKDFIYSPIQIPTTEEVSEVQWWNVKYNCKTKKFFDFMVFCTS